MSTRAGVVQRLRDTRRLVATETVDDAGVVGAEFVGDPFGEFFSIVESAFGAHGERDVRTIERHDERSRRLGDF